MDTVETKAVLLKKTLVKEYDFLFTFYTESCGKVKLYRKKVLGRNNRFQMGIEPYNILSVKFREQDRDILFLQDFSVLKSYYNIVQEIEKFYLISLMEELLEKLCPDRDVNAQLYGFLAKLLLWTEKWDRPIYQLMLFSLVKTTQLFGISPRMSECIKCRGNICFEKSAGGPYFSLEGGMVCGPCYYGIRLKDSVYPIDERTNSIVNHIKGSVFEKIANYEREICANMCDIVVKYLKYHFNIRLKSWDIISNNIL